MKKLLILAPYPHDRAPSQRFRFEQYIDDLKTKFDVEFHPFLDEKMWNTLYLEGHFAAKAFGMIKSFIRRFLLLPRIAKCDHLFIHREVAQIGPPVLEWIIAKVLRKKFVYDFDDSIWLPNYSESNATFQRIKAYWKVRYIMKWANKITAGNDHLAEFARQYNQNIEVIPTTIDTTYHVPNGTKKNEKVVIGWTGSHTTVNYLQHLDSVFLKLESSHDFVLRIISNEPPELRAKYEFVKWKKDSEIQDLSTFDIGIMPLKEDQWTSGKCGFKALQYMSLEIPTVLSPVGVNTKIVSQNKTGILASSDQEWIDALSNLIDNTELRNELGKNGRQRIEEAYSVNSQRTKYINLFS